MEKIESSEEYRERIAKNAGKFELEVGKKYFVVYRALSRNL